MLVILVYDIYFISTVNVLFSTLISSQTFD